MATTRIKDLSKTATTVNSDANLVLDGNTGGTQKITRDNFRQDTADAFVAAPGTYNLAPINSGTGKIDATYLPTSSDTPKGAWNASTNTPTLADGSGTAGDYYDVTVAGSSDLGSGSITFTVGDVVKYDGTTWFKIDSVTNILDGVSTIDGAKAAIEIPDVGSSANEVSLNGQLGTMAFQDSAGVSVGQLEVTDKVKGPLGIDGSPGSYAYSGADDLVVGDASGSRGITISTGSSDTGALYFGDAATTGLESYRGMVRYSHSSDKLELGTLSQVRATIDSSGNVGIGTASPSAVTEITGAGTGGRGLKITETSASKTSGVYTLEVDSSAHGSNTSAAGAMKIDVAGGRAMTVDGLGRVGVNQSSPGSYSSSGYDLVVGTNSGNHGATIVAGSTSTGSLFFADGTGFGAYRGRVQYNHNADQLYLGASANTNWKIVGATGNLERVSVGAGIDFGSGASTTLDEYEEGEHTCVIVTGGGSITLDGSNNKLAYTKVGNVVTVTGVLQIASVSSPTGSCVLSVPFAAASGAKHRAAGSVYVTPAVSNSIGDFSLRLTEGTDDLFIHLNTGTSPADAAAQMQANTYITVGITYIAA